MPRVNVTLSAELAAVLSEAADRDSPGAPNLSATAVRLLAAGARLEPPNPRPSIPVDRTDDAVAALLTHLRVAPPEGFALRRGRLMRRSADQWRDADWGDVHRAIVDRFRWTRIDGRSGMPRACGLSDTLAMSIERRAAEWAPEAPPEPAQAARKSRPPIDDGYDPEMGF